MTSLKSKASTVRRGPKRALYDQKAIFEIIDQTLSCTVAQVFDGQPVVTPTCHWRDGGYIYWHGHAKARNLGAGDSDKIAINIHEIDGLVLARCAFSHSINYRSVTLFGTPEPVTDLTEKEHQLYIFIERFFPDRWDKLRPVTEKELQATGLVKMPITEASAKIRTGMPVDDDNDQSWPVWAGIVACQRQWQPVEQHPEQTENYPEPDFTGLVNTIR